jgi:hypothetical protein
MYKISQIYGPGYIKRNNEIVAINRGDEITETEFQTIVSETDVECVDESTNQVIKFIASQVVYTTVTGVPALENTPATDAGRVPTDLPVGSKNAKA